MGKRWEACKQILKDFCGWTTAHGLPHVGASQSWVLFIFWSVLCLGCISMAVWQIVLIFIKFFSFPVGVAVDLKFEDMTFPAVTVCNLNPYNYSLIAADSGTGPYNKMKNLFENYRLAISGADNPSDSYGLNALRTSAVDVQSRAREQLIMLAAELSEDDPTAFEKLLFTRDEIIRNCAYNTAPCNSNTTREDFKDIVDPVYGRCFTFNPDLADMEPKYKSTRAGQLYGLRLLIVTNQTDYIPIVNSAGVRVSVHDQKEEPFPEATGFNAATGFGTSFGIRVIQTTRMPAPYGNCSETTGVSDYYYDTYSIEGCFRSCFARAIEDKCKCADPRLKKPKVSSLYCDGTRAADRDCLKSFLTMEGFNAISETNCKCVPRCVTTDFGLAISTALWPSDVFTPGDCKNAKNGKSQFPTSFVTHAECMKWYQENTLILEVFFERLSFQAITESEAYAIYNVISDLGSQLGLWMGISFLTCVEVIACIGILCCHPICVRKKDMLDDDDQPPPPPAK